MTEEENNLILGCKSNQRNAQAAFYRKFYGFAMSICLRYSHSRTEAEEMVNDGFLKVFTHIGRYDSDQEIKAWMSRIFVNTAIDHFRKNKKHYQQDDIDQAFDLASGSEDALEALSAEEIMVLIQNLAPTYKITFNLYVMEGFKHHEIADRLGISEGTSKSNLAIARAKLKRALLEKTN